MGATASTRPKPVIHALWRCSPACLRRRSRCRHFSRGRRLARAAPPLLVGPRRCARASPRTHASSTTSGEEETMSSRKNYKPGPAAGAEVRKDEEKWTLILVRELRHPPTKVWQALLRRPRPAPCGRADWTYRRRRSDAIRLAASRHRIRPAIRCRGPKLVAEEHSVLIP
jgi:hypothetical protein